MLFLFFTTAQIVVFLKGFLMNFDANSLAVSSLKIYNTSSCLRCLFGRQHSQFGSDSVFIFVVDTREGYIAAELPLECKPFRLSSSTI